jgi:hypothetical protein
MNTRLFFYKQLQVSQISGPFFVVVAINHTHRGVSLNHLITTESSYQCMEKDQQGLSRADPRILHIFCIDLIALPFSLWARE